MAPRQLVPVATERTASASRALFHNGDTHKNPNTELEASASGALFHNGDTHKNPNTELEASASGALFHNGDTHKNPSTEPEAPRVRCPVSQWRHIKIPTLRPPSQVPCLLRPPSQVPCFMMETHKNPNAKASESGALFHHGDTQKSQH